MISIAVCDDQEAVKDNLVHKINDIFSKKELDYVVKGFSSGKELLENLAQFHCVFLDIDMPGMSGYDVAEVIRRGNYNCQIIMATGRVDDYKAAFKYGVLRFITKPFSDEEISEAIDAYLSTILFTKEIEVFHNRNRYYIPISSIRYIRAINSEVEIYADGQIFRKDISLSDLETELDERLFARCHRQYIVNVSVSKMNGNFVAICDTQIPVSRRKKKELEDKIINYAIKYM